MALPDSSQALCVQVGGLVAHQLLLGPSANCPFGRLLFLWITTFLTSYFPTHPLVEFLVRVFSIMCKS